MKKRDGSISFKKPFCLLGICVLGCCTLMSASAQNTSSNAIPRTTTVQTRNPMFSDAELDQMLAPIALYPDVLMTQTLIAATYPSEAIEAGNWLKSHPNLRGKKAVEAASQTNWDDSIKSLAAFPEILVPMAEYPDWTTSLGNAFLSQQQQLMSRVQFLRQKAKEQGNLQTNEQVKVQTTQRKTIVIEPATTQVVYVPYYNPTVVYGSWWWPAYTPVYWNPWPYAGYVTSYSSGFMWSGAGLWFSYTSYRPVYDWHYQRVYIVDRNYYRPGPYRKPMPGQEWFHKPEHRHDISYRDKTYRPGPNTPGPQAHGMPNGKPDNPNRPNNSFGENHFPIKNNSSFSDKSKPPDSLQMGLTDKNYAGNRPGPSKGRPFDIPRKDDIPTYNRSSGGQGNSARPGISDNHPPINQPGQGLWANRSGKGNPVVNSPGNRPSVNRPEVNPATGVSPGSLPEQSQSYKRPSNRPMLIPNAGRPAITPPGSGSTANRPLDNAPAQSPLGNRLPNNSSLQSSAANRPVVNQPAQASSVNKPTTGSSVNFPIPGQLVNRSAPLVSRPVATARPANGPVPGHSTASRPFGGEGNHAVSVPSRQAPNRPSKPSDSGKDDDHGHGK